MVTFDSETLFAGGTTRFRIGPVKLRHAIQHTPGSLGARLDSQGTETRRIKQSGVLIADDPAELQGRVDAIRGKLDGLPYTLVDDLGRTWADTVMIEVDAETFTRIGARWKTSYQIEYLQVIP
jgi:hypothetical protein